MKSVSTNSRSATVKKDERTSSGWSGPEMNLGCEPSQNPKFEKNSQKEITKMISRMNFRIFTNIYNI